MFIYCKDNDLKNKLIKNGFQLIREEDNGSIFLFDKNIKFDFNNVDKTKFLFTNKLFF